MTAPLVSIIIPHFERPKLLLETIQSIRDQSYRHWEIQIVDDGSSSETWALIESLGEEGKITVSLREGRKKGPSACRNIGAENARGEWLFFLDSDDLIAPWCLKQRLDIAQQEEDDLHVFPVALFRESMGDMNELWNAMESPCPILNRFLISDAPWQTSSPIWRREAFFSIGGFNELVFYGDDSDLHTRALLAGLKYKMHPNAMPDAFVRRSDITRISNDASAQLVHTRRNRLLEGMTALREANAPPELLKLFSGQFFVEAEFFVFNLPQPDKAVRETIDLLASKGSVSMLQLCIAKCYLAIAIKCKAKCYVAVRLARRAAMFCLPETFFPKLTPSEERRMSKDTLAEIRHRLARTV